MRQKSDSNTDFFADDVTSVQVERLSDGEFVIVMTHEDGADSNIRIKGLGLYVDVKYWGWSEEGE